MVCDIRGIKIVDIRSSNFGSVTTIAAVDTDGLAENSYLFNNDSFLIVTDNTRGAYIYDLRNINQWATDGHGYIPKVSEI